MARYETTDIFKGAFFLSSGGILSGISFNERMIATFAITGKDLQELDHAWNSGKALVNPVTLRESLNHLRDLLFDMRDRKRRTAGNDRSTANQYSQSHG